MPEADLVVFPGRAIGLVGLVTDTERELIGIEGIPPPRLHGVGCTVALAEANGCLQFIMHLILRRLYGQIHFAGCRYVYQEEQLIPRTIVRDVIDLGR